MIKTLVEKLESDIKLGRLHLPKPPDVAMRLRNAIQDPNRNSQEIAKIIQTDPALAARLIQIVNSPIYRARSPINDCHSAIMRLGMETTGNLVMCFTVKQNLHLNKHLTKAKLMEVWNHSCEMAAICHVLSKTDTRLKPDRAMLAGLIHDIGALPVLHYLDEFDEPELLSSQVIDICVSRLKPKVGSLMLRMWKFEDSFVEASEHAEDWGREKKGKDYADLLIAAHVTAELCGYNTYLDFSRVTDLPAYKKFPMSKFGIQGAYELLHYAEDEIRAVFQLLI